MDWNNEKIIQFIKEMELYPVLWDCNNKNYKNRNRKHDAAEELAKKLDCDSTEILRKWKIILSQYRRERKKVADSKTSGSGVSEVYKPKWFGYSYLNFLQPNEITSEDITEQLTLNVEERADNEYDESSQEKSSEIFRTPNHRMKRRAVDEDLRITRALSMMENISKQMTRKNHDDDDVYAASVTIKLRKIKDERTKILVQKEIDNLLYDAIIGTGKFSPIPVPSPYSDSQSQESASGSRHCKSEYSDSAGQDDRGNSPHTYQRLTIREISSLETLNKYIKVAKESPVARYRKAFAILIEAVLDSSAKIPPGILYGNIISFGNYEECTEVQNNDAGNEIDIKGKYCSTVVTMSKSNLDFDVFSDNLVKAADEFDFSQVRMIFGLCVPSGCNSEDLQSISNALFPDVLPIRLTFMDKFCSTKDSEEQLPTRTIIGIIIFCSFGMLLILGTVADVFNSSDKDDILKCFSIYSNGKKLFNSKVGEDSLLCLNGLRVLSMFLIILGHRLIMTNGLPAVNKILIDRWKEEWLSYIFIGLGFAVDTFFTISGLLVVYIFMRVQEKGQSINWGLFYLHRFLRLTPSLVMVVLFYATMVNLFQHEPFAVIDEYLGETCREYWWTTLLYIQNYWNPNNMCAVHTWYLAVDTHLYILSPLLLISLKKFPKKTIGAMILITLISIMAAFEVTWEKKLGATFLNQNPEEYKNLYTPTHIRVPSWLLGAITGYFIAKYRGQPVKLNKLSVMLLWIISLGSLLLVLLVQKYYHDNEYNVWYSAIYNSLARPLWAAAVCVVIILCVFGHGGIVNNFLSCSLFNVLIRINYAVYLVHMMVSVSILAKLRAPIFLSNFVVIHETLGDYFVILLVAIIWTLAFESPIIALEKFLIPGGREKSKCSTEKNNSNLSNRSCETIIVK